MLGFAWLNLRQAQEALKNGLLEEALRLLNQPGAMNQRGSGALLSQIARAFADRGDRHLRNDEIELAWRDLLQAEQLQTTERAPERLRQSLTRLGLAEVRAQLQAGHPAQAEEAATRLKSRGVIPPELRALEEAARVWTSARADADRGEFIPALTELDQARSLLPASLPVLEQAKLAMLERQRAYLLAQQKMHVAANARRWAEVAELTEQILAVAPQHAEARRARGMAWKAVEPITVTLPKVEAENQADNGPVPLRFLLWIDGVGGFLICLGSRISLGQSAAEARIDVPIVADISRLHAMMTRDAEGYMLEAVREIQVNGQPTIKTPLRSGDRVTLGSSCQFVFRLPVPASTTARLDIVSGHRLPLSVDGVILMADTLILGSGPHAHINVPDLKDPIVLYRIKDGLGARHAGSIQVNGEKHQDRATLGSTANVVCDDVSFALEPAGVRPGFR